MTFVCVSILLISINIKYIGKTIIKGWMIQKVQLIKKSLHDVFLEIEKK